MRNACAMLKNCVIAVRKVTQARELQVHARGEKKTRSRIAQRRTREIPVQGQGVSEARDRECFMGQVERVSSFSLDACRVLKTKKKKVHL